MSYSFSASIMLAAGLGIPILASLNAALGQFIGSPVVAVIVLLGVAFLSICLISLTTNNFPMTKLIEAPKHLFIAGFFVGISVYEPTGLFLTDLFVLSQGAIIYCLLFTDIKNKF